ncbi:hybrid sensor histidine kinase/response regulator [Ancylothrix sp. C2]|uniref:hybrid sensor histidine kinase/response regulator n=1 Tax=Ancylothrix sp. D3o TaxID=2953691 RepID=UPI0021BA42EA|nr:hybrid sensor histidine kinase/response regulator [Ancylothrix sp. D3o]MCT7950051.1 hybrid sensor histidine kinase/response regulator [Ancylothrix sp. D3o]
MSDYTIAELFRKETETQITTLKQCLSLLKTQPSDHTELERSIKATHDLWGMTQIIEKSTAANLAKLMKDCFIGLQKQTCALGDEQIEVLLHACDLLLSMSQTPEEELERWMSEHSWDLTTTQKSISIFLGSRSASTPPPAPASSKEPVETTNQPAQPALAETNPTPITTPATDVLPERLYQPIVTDSSMMELFRLELEAQASVLNNGLLALESQPQSGQDLEALMRAAHSIKGAARIVCLESAVNLAHVMEDCFVAAQNKAITLNADNVDVLLQAVDLLSNICQVGDNELPSWVQAQAPNFENITAEISAILHPGAVVPQTTKTTALTPTISAETGPQSSEIAVFSTQSSSPAPPTLAQNRPSAPTQATSTDTGQDRVVRVSAENLNRIMGLAGESLIEANWLQPFADSMTSLKSRLGDLGRTLEQFQESLNRKISPQESKEYLEQARQYEQECVQLLGERLDELELYARRTANLSDRLYREVITSNMRPFADGIQGFPRMIRDLARKLNKQVKLEILGKSTPVDRDILKKLEAPLTHILRNAVDHGLEMPDERINCGKMPEGTIRLEAFHRGGMLAITIADDGRGMNLEQLRQKIITKNLASAEMAAQLSDAELMEFIFLPGFSTAKQVTEISGRGVGLDIAKSMAAEVGGTVRAISAPGKGMSFYFQLPLTLSVVRTLLVQISGNPYAVPLARLDQIVTLAKEEIFDVENRQYFTMNEQNIGLIAAHQVLELPAPPPQQRSVSVVVISEASSTYGLIVDKFLGERDLVVRPLDPRLGKVPDISAAALLADGTPVLILDVPDMVRSMDAILKGGRLAKVNIQSEAEIAEKRKKILVVDDSITVREMQRKLLENKGYSVELAVNGVEGWNAVRTKTYDLVVSDIDMPRMNGIELVRCIKTHPRLNSLPVIIVSYRDREEDRLQGLEAGADYYLTKSSFQDDTLIEAVFDLIGC